jgi:hypothetical protein
MAATLFRSYSDDAFTETGSWAELARILKGNGGAYGLYGPRGSGKSWLMHRAIFEAERDGGMGLWLPCPSGDDTSALLSALSDNLASEVEQRFIRNDARWAALRWLQVALALIAGIPIVAAVLSYVFRGLDAKLPQTIFGTLPRALWYGVGTAILVLIYLTVLRFLRANRSAGRLAQEATALRERIRYTTALKQGVELDLSGGSRFTGAFKRTTEKDLDERPTTVASLIFDFRRLAASIVMVTGERLVIGIDELDKLDDADAARKLLRDIKGMFEIPGVLFLVSVSEEAVTALQLGPLQSKGRNEFNSSFYTVLEIPALSVPGIKQIASQRGWPMSGPRAELFCLLSAGNLREFIRLADRLSMTNSPPDWDLSFARRTLRAETAALLREVVRVCGETADQVLPDAWQALPTAAFESPEAFEALGRTAIRDHWDLGQADSVWRDSMAEPWRRFLIRLFIVGRAAPMLFGPQPGSSTFLMSSDLRDVLIMASRSTSVALLMLRTRYGDDLAGLYTRPPGVSVFPDAYGAPL